MKILSELETACLEAVSNDYENLILVRDQVIDWLGCDVSLEEIVRTLSSLSDGGLIGAFLIDARTGTFIPANGNSINQDKLWFLASKSGLTILKETMS